MAISPFTVTTQTAVCPSALAVMRTVPGALARTVPSASTVATASSSLAKATVWPSAGHTAASSFIRWPGSSRTAALLSEMLCTACPTVTRHSAARLEPGRLARTTVSPSATAVTRPFSSTAATAGSSLMYATVSGLLAPSTTVFSGAVSPGWSSSAVSVFRPVA